MRSSAATYLLQVGREEEEEEEEEEKKKKGNKTRIQHDTLLSHLLSNIVTATTITLTLPQL